jgi:hypothetical protein
MASDAVSPEHAFDASHRTGSCDWRDEFWAVLIGSVDARLRAYYRIREFTCDERCILRLAIDRAPAPVILADGTTIAAGERIGALHLWNEHLPRYSGQGPDLGWAGNIRRQVAYSLCLLAAEVEHESGLPTVRAFRAEAMLASRLGLAQLDRLAERHGFEAIATRPTLLGWLRTLGDCVNVWCLTRAFNPGALPRQRWRRERHELWISRTRLLALYGHAASRSRGQAPAGARRTGTARVAISG